MSGPIESGVLTWCTAATGIFTKTPGEALNTMAAMVPHQEIKTEIQLLHQAEGTQRHCFHKPGTTILRKSLKEKPAAQESRPLCSQDVPSDHHKQEQERKSCLQHSALKKRKIKIVFKISPLGNTRYPQFFSTVVFITQTDTKIPWNIL